MRIKFDRALEIAIETVGESNMRHKLGCCLFDKSQYVIGHNRAFNVEVPGRENEFSVHAEELAIIRGNRMGIKFEDATLIVVRINKSGDLRVSRPCETCQRLISKVGIKTVYYVER